MLAQAITLYKHGRWRVWLGFAARIETKRERGREKEEPLERSRNERKRKGRERERKKERGHCGLRLKRSVHPSGTSAVPCPLFSLKPLNPFPAFLLFPFRRKHSLYGDAASKNDPNGSRFPRAPPSYRRFRSLTNLPLPLPVVSQAREREKARKSAFDLVEGSRCCFIRVSVNFYETDRDYN